MDWKAKLKEAKELFEDGLIDEEDYKEMKKEALALRKKTSSLDVTAAVQPSLENMGTMVNTSMDMSMASPPQGLDNMGTMVGDASMLSVPTVDFDNLKVIGNYNVIEKIGQGGMGAVYRARHQIEEFAKKTGDVVIKLMKPELASDPNFRNRFLGEAATGRDIQHPNFVSIYDLIVDLQTSTLAIVMEYIEGQTLEDLIPENGMDVEQAMPIVEALCSALDYIHQKSIIHRDLKPENIMITPTGVPMILDLGIAKNTNEASSMTRTGTGIGTLLYMAPEQGDAKNVTSAADRYALGLIVYQMLAGRLPWDEEAGEWQIVSAKMMGTLVPLHEAVDCSQGLSTHVMALLNNKQEDRPSTCAAFWELIQSIGLEHLDTVTCGEGDLEHTLVYIEGGEYAEFISPDDSEAWEKEKRTLTHQISTLLVGQQLVGDILWNEVMSIDAGDKELDIPIRSITWKDAVEFCNALSKLEALKPAYVISETGVEINDASEGYRLLFEHEWEYLAKAKSQHIYAGSESVDEVAQCSKSELEAMGTRASNGFGLFDMCGTVFEWCNDAYDHSGVEVESVELSTLYRAARGGAWSSEPSQVRCTSRQRFLAAEGNPLTGLRVVRTVVQAD